VVETCISGNGQGGTKIGVGDIITIEGTAVVIGLGWELQLIDGQA